MIQSHMMKQNTSQFIMSKIYIFIMLLTSSLISNDNLFITNYEYGEMLYKNPRGIGCIKCHGKNGKIMFIARYTHDEKEFELNAPSINKITLEKFIKKLKSKSNSKSIMPTYFLTNDEMKQIHFYITQKNSNE